MEMATIILLCCTLLSTLRNSMAVDTIRAHQAIRDGETITSSGGEFELGFFSPGRSTYRYLGIWYKKISSGTVVWVANRNTPIMNTLGMARVDDKGITLKTDDGIIWSSNMSLSMKNPVAQLLDSGNLVLRDDDHDTDDNFIWQSFDYPGDNLLPGMKLGFNLVTGLDWLYTSWKSIDDPSTGIYIDRVDRNGFPQVFLLRGSVNWHRFGPYNGRQFSGAPFGIENGFFTEKFVISEREVYYKFNLIKETSAVVRYTLTPQGETKILVWNYQNQTWNLFAPGMVTGCDRYGLCGAYGICNINSSPVCECLTGFVPKSQPKWTAEGSSGSYANADIRRGGSGCILWFNDLIDMMGYTEDGQDIYVKMPASKLVDSQRPKLIVLVPVVLLVVAVALAFLYVSRRRRQKAEENLKLGSENVALNKTESEDWDLPLVDFKKIVNATDNFSLHNKLGEGGFGLVYKGILEDGQEIAVKRLSKNSDQGLDEFINEVSFIAKLQHRNLGLLYLHEDSKLRIIHRDLKASNILLDHEMNPKISDFGMARCFEGSQIEAYTSRIVGTYGYMSPEYAIDGQFSVKSDVYSFGVLLIEIVSGQKNRLFTHPDHSLNLLGHAWNSYNDDKLLEVIDEVMLESCNLIKVFRVIHIGLLCVQEDPVDRPDMSAVVLMLSSDSKLAYPKKPGFFMERKLRDRDPLLSNPYFSSCNKFSITSIVPRQ
ncbi:hypothetical protein DCAR_0104200 [Daucus carota subsp. sativus]|uniref:Receptor-like serine/threonine-protein kinase n=1 Tax=Daucus carota subsp. sativus TaxID=79200 RepID=A0AAF0W9M4_DAUCS|nr:hypothetical protein DCAR_0104200 [Daucus carota subsp. sativus]